MDWNNLNIKSNENKETSHLYMESIIKKMHKRAHLYRSFPTIIKKLDSRERIIKFVSISQLGTVGSVHCVLKTIMICVTVFVLYTKVVRLVRENLVNSQLDPRGFKTFVKLGKSEAETMR